MTMQLEDWLDDLCVRFIVNIPAEELDSIERICFQIEEAQWFYEDFIRPLDPSLPSLSLKPFFQRITQRCPIFDEWAESGLGDAFEMFIKYKNRVPVRGAILLNHAMDEVLLVKGFKKSATWSFPRGKINKDEDDLDCAIREAWEETGFDLRKSGLVQQPRKIKSIEKTMRSQNMKLFVFRGVPMDANFEPQTRKEISKIQWFRLADLPTEKKRNQQEGTGQHLVLNANKFYVVAPFMHDIKKIINAERRKENRSSRLAAAPMTNDPVVEAEQQYAATTGSLAMPMSPAIPSNLPEVSQESVEDPTLRLKQLMQIGIQTDSQPAAPAPKSQDLLALLRGKGSAAEMRNEPHTPFEQTMFPAQPRSPERPLIQAHHSFMNMQSPPPSFELHPQAHPAAPSSSALPQITPHARNLLDAFTKPAPQQAMAQQARQPKSDNRQQLLAAFSAPSKPTPRPTPSPGAFSPINSDLLRLLRTDSGIPAELPKDGYTAAQPVQTQGLTPPVINAPPATVNNSSMDLLSLLQRPASRSTSRSAAQQQPVVQQPTSIPSVVPTPQLSVKHTPLDLLSLLQQKPQSPAPITKKAEVEAEKLRQPSQARPISPSVIQSPPPEAKNNSADLLSLFSQKPSTIVPAPAPAPAPQAIMAPTARASYARAASMAQRPTPMPHVEPAELSAADGPAQKVPGSSAQSTSVQVPKSTVTGPASAQSANTTSLAQLPRKSQPKSRSGTTAATLDAPVAQPQFDAIAKAPAVSEDIKRDPAPSDRKLFDFKQGSMQSPASRVVSRSNDRGREPKSPRTLRQKQTNTSRPSTPKEAQKPFQPQILKRPQTSEGEGPTGLPSLLAQNSAAPVASPLILSPEVASNGPLSPSINAPQVVSSPSLASFFSSKSPPPQDPQKQALLSFLKSPAPTPISTDADTTPKPAHSTSVQPQHLLLEETFSPSAQSHIVSPVYEGEHGFSAPRSRVSSLASSVVAGKPAPERKQTQNPDFFMSFLKGMSSQGQGQEAV